MRNNLADDVTELVHAEVMRRVFDPVDDEIPDGTVNFAAHVDGMIDRVERVVYSLPRAERPAYFLERAREMLAWCQRIRAPDLLTERVRSWLARLERDGNRRSSSDR